ncbi:hypothetical protein ACFOY4_05645 [Actinomadura syzygii]|uniref:Uncharacterized protein n=1 Tax=Actinomadura syzygii TaxID=1427538 RepID=A0A5D0TXF9_9ACTN|nr:hypothetical protein [Actinomadura syzygii]TYC10414.1 hypothetical protein FXF65_31440 [Actinomadura syzygii]
MTMRRILMMAGGAVLPVAVFALLFDNQWVVDAIRDSDFRYNEGIGPLVSWSHALAWRFTPGDGSKWTFVLAVDFTTLLFFVLLAALVAAAARFLDVNRGPLGALIVGWWAAIVAAGIAGLVFGPLLYWTLDLRSASEAIFSSISQGVSSGFAFGWIAGLGAVGGFLMSRPRTPGVQQPYGGGGQAYGMQPGMQPGTQLGVQQPQQPYGGQQPYVPQQMHQQPMPQQAPPQQMQPQQPMPPQQPMQPHPSAVPYVPPQGQGQQPPWGAAPVPPQQQPGAPAPQQFGAPPVPPQQPAQPIAQPAQPAVPSAPQAPAPEPAADDEEPPEPENAAERDDAPADPPEDTPERDDDDLDLADRTRIDRQRDE